MPKASTIILVHGAWADGSCWSKVIPILTTNDLAVTAVQLPLTSLDQDVLTLKRAITLADGPVVLVGHSYGGAVITEGGNDSKVSALVYVAAFAPDKGESAGSLGAGVAASPVAAEVRPDAQGFLKITEPGIREDFAQDLTDVEKTIVFVTQSPTNGAALGGTVSEPAWRSKPTWYLVAKNDRAIQPDLERTMAGRMQAVTVEVDSSHLAMLARPEETADLILQAAS